MATGGGLFSFPDCVIWISVTGFIVGAVFFVKNLMKGGTFTKNTRADGKVVIITGSNTGIGKETAMELARRGAKVYLACRDMNKCEQARDEIVSETKNKNIYCRKCDLASMESIRKFAENFKKEEQRLDILVNNAGVMRCPRALTEDGFELQLGVNHMGHFLLTNLLLDILKKSSPSRIVVVSSMLHAHGEINVEDLNSERSYDEGKAYNQSKLANVMFTRELAKRLEGTGVTVNSLHPGVVDTDLFRYMVPPLALMILQPLSWPLLKSPKSGAQTTLYAALDEDLSTVSGQYFSDCDFKEVAPQAKDDALAKWLWAESEKWTKLSS